MAQMQGHSRRNSEASDSLTVTSAAKGAPGKTPATARLAASGAPRAQSPGTSVVEDTQPNAADQITSRDIMYEIIAHKMGYQDSIGSVEGDLLAQWGYERQWVGRINDAATGLFCGLIKPDEDHPDLVPILVFRGSSELRDFISDLHPAAVGYDQFRQNQHIIQQLVAEAGGRVDCTGHSLGGALAQHCAAAFTSSVNHVITFQSPGIDGAGARRFAETSPDGRPTVTHHIAGGDLVDTAGDGHLDGEFFRHSPGGGPRSHVKYLLTTPEFADKRQELGLTDEVLAQLGIARQTNHKPVEHSEKYPHPLKNVVDESVRTGVGVSLYPILNGVSVLTRNDDKALREQIAASDQSVLAATPLSERSYMVDRLCRGVTGDGDERAILKVLEASVLSGDAVRLIDIVGPHLIACNLHGGEYDDLRAFYRAHYYSQCGSEQALGLIRRCIDHLANEWEEQMIADLLVQRSDGRALITRLGEGSFAMGMKLMQFQLDGGDQRRVDAMYAS